MTNAELIYDIAKLAVTASASKGAKIIVDEIVENFTPEDLDNKKKACVEIAKWGAATAFGAVCAKSVGDKIEKGKACYDAVVKFVSVIKEENAKKSEPVVEGVEDNNIVEIEEPEEIEDENLEEK